MCSKKRFQITEQGDSVEFLSWFINSIDTAFRLKRKFLLATQKKVNIQNIISRTFRGEMRIYSRKIMPSNLTDEKKSLLSDNPDYMVSLLI